MLAAAIDGLQELPERTAADVQLLAGLREQRGRALYEAGDADAARDLLLAAIADLEPGPPSAARAALLDRLGWTSWRAGRVAEAVPILERAIAEARACSSEPTLRWATHNLGVALAFLEHQDEAVALLEESFRMAREADDRGLLMRCYINLPAVRYGRGDPAGAAHRHARRWPAHGPAGGSHAQPRLAGRQPWRSSPARWVASTKPWRMPTRPSTTPRSSVPSHWSARLLSRALIRRYRGEPETPCATSRRRSVSAGTTSRRSPPLHPLNVALRDWPDDAPGAAAALADWVATRRADRPVAASPSTNWPAWPCGSGTGRGSTSP